MENKLIEILNNGSSFAYGFLLDENEKNYLIKNLDDQGRFDGYTLISKNLVKINEKSDFLKKLKIYNEYWKSNKEENTGEIFKNMPDFFDMVKYAKENKKIINLGKSLVYFDQICGYIKNIEDDFAIIDAVDINSGQIYDEFEIDIREIKYIEIESIDNILLDFVNKK
ncbi:hypothetical protein [Anaerococcus vaginalis]|uniref:hypothetical protein n=1 Tax=Anaerococcus vaginalis TaxID=33037 RepID=UPI0029145E75|nr:hypothetical protein [Anaerococcus vaginalis]MDU5560741.1 hypothetical protein [Anaerococcus vaginalis]